MKLQVVILTLNEEIHIERAIESLRRIAVPLDILVVDSFSADRTCDIARKSGARVVQRVFINQAEQFDWAITHLVSADWVMRLDADEIVPIPLAIELTDFLRDPGAASHVVIPRRHVFLGRPLRYGGRGSTRLLRLWRPGTAVIESRWMDEHIVAVSGHSFRAKNEFFDWNLKDLSFFCKKHVDYATREAVQVLLGSTSADRGELTAQARLRRLLKEKVFYRLPFAITSTAYFFLRFVVLLGCLDGAEGLIYHVLQGFWYRFLVGARLKELKSAVRSCRTLDARIARLRELTGLDIH